MRCRGITNLVTTPRSFDEKAEIDFFLLITLTNLLAVLETRPRQQICQRYQQKEIYLSLFIEAAGRSYQIRYPPAAHFRFKSQRFWKAHIQITKFVCINCSCARV
jgi:hypothetical protein